MLVCLAVVVGVTGLTAVSVSASESQSAARGGTYVVAFESAFGWTNGFDPTGEYLANGIAIYQSLLVRRLVGYNHVGGPAGNIPVPDLATSLPKPTNGGKTWTFRIKQGVRFGPPVNREITSGDIRYAFERAAKPRNGAQYSFYYNVIKGFQDYGAGKAKRISGIATPNAKTISFTTTTPTGDFLNRVGLPAAGPIPQEVAKCFEGKPGRYGLNLVSSGPYMIEGSDNADISSCAGIKPLSGISETELNLVRNPNYNAATDSKKARESLPDRFEFVVNTNADDIFNKIAAGDYEDLVGTPTPKVISEYTRDANKRKLLKASPADQTYYITMNLTQPPFDDVRVRRAMNWVMDRDGLRKAWGGPTAGLIADHVIPDVLLSNRLKSFKPFKTPGDRGDVAKAKAEMAKSKYANSGGVCTAKECKNVLLIVDVRSADKGMLAVLQSSARKIGITFAARSVNGAYPVIQTTSRNVPISTRPRWGKDYADPSTFIDPLFVNIIPTGNTNYSLVGITPAQAGEIGVKGSVNHVPSVTKDAQRCGALTGSRRIACYAAIDRKLTTEIVPWIPYMWANQINVLGPDVATWQFDQSATVAGYAHASLKG
jgi:peptide/nickel transport system substrate-binding protein